MPRSLTTFCLVCLSVSTAAARHLFRGNHGFRDYGNTGLSSGPRGNSWPGLWSAPQPPCPQYRPMSVSNWRRSSTGGFELSASLPGVPASHRHVWLEEGDRALRIHAARPVSRELLACLPRGTRVSQDGRYEIFDATVPVAATADHSRAALRQKGSALRIVMPLRTEVAEDTTATARPSSSSRSPSADDSVEMSAAGTAEDVDRAPCAHNQDAQLEHLSRQQSPSPTELALAQGVEVVEEDFPWPEKQADAAAGWWDNRGDLHEYGGGAGVPST